MFWVLQAFVAISSLYCKAIPSYVQAVKARDAIHGFVCISKVIKITHI